MAKSGQPPRHDAQRSRLIEIARDTIGQRGIAGTRLSDVAEAAEMTTPAIYWYFANRRELMLAAIREHGADFSTRVVADDTAAQSAPTRIGDRLHAWTDYVQSSGQSAVRFHFRAVIESRDDPELWDELQPIVDEARSFWQQILADGQRAGTIRADIDRGEVVEMILAATAGLDLCYAFDLVRGDAASLYKSFVAMLLDFIQVAVPPSSSPEPGHENRRR